MQLPLAPLSACYGYDRGHPADRICIETFLADHASVIRGDGAEIKADTYLRRFGEDRLRPATIIDTDPANARAALHADLAIQGSLPRRHSTASSSPRHSSPSTTPPRR